MPDEASLRALRVALAHAVVAIENLGGCIDVECEHDTCWLADLGHGRARVEIERAIGFVTEDWPDLGTVTE